MYSKVLGARARRVQPRIGVEILAYPKIRIARILEPWLYEGMRVFEPSNSPEENRRWVRRFLD